MRLLSAELLFRSDSANQGQAALRALGSMPNATYSERLADLLPGEDVKFLAQALEENPRLTSARIAFGLLQERGGDLDGAERTLLQAARYDRQYLPAWTLANFYFRRDNADRFWQWARRAAELNYDNPRSLLRLASLLEPKPAVSLDRLQGGENFAYAYLDVLIGARRIDSAQALVPVLFRDSMIRRNQLLDLTTRQLRAGNVSWALETWNALCGTPPMCTAINPERGPLLPAPALGAADGEGFDISLLSNSGINSALITEEHETLFSLNGSQPDPSPLLEQPIAAPRRGGLRYRLRYEYRNSAATGVRWSMAGSESPALSPCQDWQWGEWTIFPQPSLSNDDKNGRDKLRVLKLQLVYHREPGTTPARGELRLRDLQLTIF